MKNILQKIYWAIGAIGTVAVAFLNPDLLEDLIKHLEQASQNQFAKNVFVFSVAAFIHSGRMKKEIRTNFEALVFSIDKVAATLHEDLKKHGDRLDGLTNRVHALEITGQLKKES